MRRYDIILLATAGLSFIVLRWLIPMGSSLWLDELGTYWVIADDLGSTIDRALRFHGQTPLYYALVWATTQVFGTSEFVMRLPSLVAMIAAAGVLYRMTSRMFDRNTAVLATAIFIVIPPISAAAADARPYALATLATIVATDILDRWHRNPRPGLAVAYGFAAAFIVFSHYVFATILVAHLCYHVWRLRSLTNRSIAIRQTVIAGATFVVLLAPAVSQVAGLLGRRDELTFSTTPLFHELISVWALPMLGIVLLGVVVWRLTAGSGRLPRLRAGPMVLVTLGFVTPPVMLFLMGNLTDVLLWVERYWMVAFPFGAIMIGVVLASLLETTLGVQRMVVGILALAILSISSFDHSVEDWRSAIAEANRAIGDPDTPVLLYASLIESSNPEYLMDAERRSYLSSPAVYYPLEGAISPLPWYRPASDYPERILPILDLVAGEPEVVMITNQFGGTISRSYISGWMVAEGYEITTLSQHGAVTVTAFER